MSIGDTIRSRPRLGIAAATAAILLLAVIIVSSLRSATPAAPSVPSQLYFSDDDGKTYFADDSARVPPFEHKGKQAYQAAVFRCPGKPLFVGYLMSYTPAASSALLALPEAQRRSSGANVMEIRQSGALVKKPGQTQWVALSSGRRVGYILTPSCPDGSTDQPEQVVP